DTETGGAGAEPFYRRAIAAAPESWEVHYHYAILLAEAGRTSEAEGKYRRALELADLPVAHAGYGQFLARAERWSEAREHYLAALEQRPDDADTWRRLGGALGALEARDEALAAFARARTLAPDNPTVSHQLGGVLQDWGEIAGAERAYRQALALRPGYLPARLDLAELLELAGQDAEAL